MSLETGTPYFELTVILPISVGDDQIQCGPKLTNRCTAKQLVEVLDIKRRRFGDRYAVTPDSQGYLYLETIRRYAQSADDEIGPQHVPTLVPFGPPRRMFVSTCLTTSFRFGNAVADLAPCVREVSSFALDGARRHRVD